MGIFQNGPDNDDQLNFVLCLCVCFVFCVFLCKKMSMPSFKMSRSDYYDLLLFSIESGRCQHILIWFVFDYLEVKWLLEDFKTMATLERSSPRTAVLSQIVFEWIWWWEVFLLVACSIFFLWPLKFGQISYGLGRASEFRAGPIRHCITIIIAMFLFF